MANALDAVLSLVATRNAQQQQQTDNLNTGIKLLNDQMQNARQNQLGQLQVRAGLAQNALQLGPDGSISYNGNLLNPFQQKVAAMNFLSAAKQTGLPSVFQSAANGLGVNGGNGQPAPNTTPLTYPVMTGQLNQLLSSNGASQNTAAPGNTVDGLTVMGGNRSVDAVTGVPSDSFTLSNLLAQNQQAQSGVVATAKGTAQVENNQAQSQLDQSANTGKQLMDTYQGLFNNGAAGKMDSEFKFNNEKPLAMANDKLGIKGVNSSTDQQNAQTFKTMASQLSGNLSPQLTASFGSKGSNRINSDIDSALGIQDITSLNQSPADLKGKIAGVVKSGYLKKIAAQNYFNSLTPGQNPSESQVTNGVVSAYKSLSPNQIKAGNDLVNSVVGYPEYNKNTEKLQYNQKTGEVRVVSK